MWSHYANNHRGVCVLYDVPEDYLNDGESFVGLSSVSYKPNPLTSWFRTISNRMPSTEQELITELLKVVLKSKEKSWKYEKEYRVITFSHGVKHIPKLFVKQICFGLQASNSDVDLVREITKDFESTVDLYRIDQGRHDYGVRYNKI